jgi:hypothetical protein
MIILNKNFSVFKNKVQILKCPAPCTKKRHCKIRRNEDFKVKYFISLFKFSAPLLIRSRPLRDDGILIVNFTRKMTKTIKILIRKIGKFIVTVWHQNKCERHKKQKY